MNYRKEIYTTDTGMVIAKVIDDSGKCNGIEFFT
jgi:hypothetical protein